LDLLRERRPIATPRKEFLQQLIEWEKKLYGVATVSVTVPQRTPTDPKSKKEKSKLRKEMKQKKERSAHRMVNEWEED
jgi:hypothetical protein